MRNIIKGLILGGFTGGMLLLATPTLAATPILSATYQGSVLQLSVSNANAFSTISLKGDGIGNLDIFTDTNMINLHALVEFARTNP